VEVISLRGLTIMRRRRRSCRLRRREVIAAWFVAGSCRRELREARGAVASLRPQLYRLAAEFLRQCLHALFEFAGLRVAALH